jgi:hypothetical protein
LPSGPRRCSCRPARAYTNVTMEKEPQEPKQDGTGSGPQEPGRDAPPPFDPDPELVTLLEGGSKRKIAKLRARIAAMRETG